MSDGDSVRLRARVEGRAATPEWKNRVWKDGIANIDEHLNGWGDPGSKSVYATDIRKHVWAMNEVQRFFVEETRLGIPVDFTDEGIRGVAYYTATSFPAQPGVGSTWDKELVREIGRITGREARALGYTNVYSPIMDVGRDQRWGRMEEVYGEDPYLVARLGVEPGAFKVMIGSSSEDISEDIRLQGEFNIVPAEGNK